MRIWMESQGQNAGEFEGCVLHCITYIGPRLGGMNTPLDLTNGSTCLKCVSDDRMRRGEERRGKVTMLDLELMVVRLCSVLRLQPPQPSLTPRFEGGLAVVTRFTMQTAKSKMLGN